MVQRGIDVVLMIGDKKVAGQRQASLNRNMSPIEITNQIDGEWKEYLGGLRNWSISCDGLYVVNEESLKQLEDAFMNNTDIDVKITITDKNYFGRVLITDFPLSSNYNDQFKYRLTLLGDGPLQYENN